jgi:hypothetical protein
MIYNKYQIFISAFVFLLAFSNFSCTDKCKDKICENGYCIKGDCFCEDGYSGENCEIKESEKFAGKYSGKIICDNLEQPVNSIIDNNFDDPRKITLSIDNFSSELMFKGHIKKDSIFIENQFIEAISSYIDNGTVYYDTIIYLIYPTAGKLTNKKNLNFNLKIRADELTECAVNLVKN